MSQARNYFVSTAVPRIERRLFLLGNQLVRDLDDALSVPVGRDAAGNVTQRSAPGEHPRTETGRLREGLSSHVVTDAGAGNGLEVELVVVSARPPRSNDPADVPQRLEYGIGDIAPRPYMRPSFEEAKTEAPKALRNLTGGV